MLGERVYSHIYMPGKRGYSLIHMFRERVDSHIHMVGERVDSHIHMVGERVDSFQDSFHGRFGIHFVCHNVQIIRSAAEFVKKFFHAKLLS